MGKDESLETQSDRGCYTSETVWLQPDHSCAWRWSREEISKWVGKSRKGSRSIIHGLRVTDAETKEISA